MSLIEGYRLPSPPHRCQIKGHAQPVVQRTQLLGDSQYVFERTKPLFHFDAAAIDSLEDRIELARNHLPFTFCDGSFKFRGESDTKAKWRVGTPVELFHQRHEMLFGFAHIGTGKTYQVVAAGKRLQALEDLAEKQ